MIDRYNRTQFIKALLCLVGGVICCCIAYAFFGLVPSLVSTLFGYKLPAIAKPLIGLLGLGIAFISGYQTWKNKGGLVGYHESAFYHDMGTDSASAVVTDFYAHRITGPAYMLSQIFMAGPVYLLKARTLLASRIEQNPGLEAKLEDTLTALRAANKWQGLSDYPHAKEEVLYLAQMGLIDFSAHKGNPRFKAHLESASA